MPYNLVDASNAFTERNFVADFFQVKCIFWRKTANVRFWTTFWGA